MQEAECSFRVEVEHVDADPITGMFDRDSLGNMLVLYIASELPFIDTVEKRIESMLLITRVKIFKKQQGGWQIIYQWSPSGETLNSRIVNRRKALEKLETWRRESNIGSIVNLTALIKGD